MVEKFSDYESVGFLNKTGEFEFEITEYELKDSKSGEPMAVFTAKSDEGQTTLYHSLGQKARWSYNNLIKACLKLDTKEKINSFECDYQTIGKQLIGKKFIGVVEQEKYTKSIKVPQDDGTFIDGVEEKDSYKVKSYKMI
jgi:hypothetical protein